MKAKHKLTALGILAAAGVVVYIGESISSDALAVIVGVVFGMAALIPALLFMAWRVNLRDQADNERRQRWRYGADRQLPAQSQAPVIVVIPPAQPEQQHDGEWYTVTAEQRQLVRRG